MSCTCPLCIHQVFMQKDLSFVVLGTDAEFRSVSFQEELPYSLPRDKLRLFLQTNSCACREEIIKRNQTCITKRLFSYIYIYKLGCIGFCFPPHFKMFKLLCLLIGTPPASPNVHSRRFISCICHVLLLRNDSTLNRFARPRT